MPEVSPRRSSRARAVQPPHQLVHNNSSSSVSSGRGDRNIKTENPRTSAAASSSEHSEDIDQLEHETRQTRRSKREHNVTTDLKIIPAEEVIDDEDGEEDVTRCICGKAEYPGPPPALGITDPDIGSLFIQCDTCHVWQHGGCVGIMNDNEVPDNYFCERCRPHLHKVFNGSRTQKYSRYLPVVEARAGSPPRKKAPTKDAESRTTKDAAIKQALLNANGRRRATMNSRAAYEEDEMLRRALEESKGVGGNESSASGQRRSKRARDDSDNSDHDMKRQKTGSDSPPASSAIGADADSDIESSRPRSKIHASKGRNGRSQMEQDREVRRRELEREQERQAAASRRKGRAERRNVDEIEAEAARPPAISKSSTGPTTKSHKSQPTTRPQQTSPTRLPVGSHKKGARPARRGKVGRNQYTRERDAAADARAEAARALHSRDGEDGIMDNSNAYLLPNGSKPAKPKHMNPNRTSMNELRKRAAGVLEYISRTQVEMAGERTSSGSQTPSKNGSKSGTNGKSMVANSTSKLSNEVSGSVDPRLDDPTVPLNEAQDKLEANDFKNLTSLQMMDVLTREIVHWQQQHGKWGEK